MLQTLMTLLINGMDSIISAGHTSQTALAVVMCAALINLFH